MKKLALNTPSGIKTAAPIYIPKECQPPYCAVCLALHHDNCTQYRHSALNQQPTTSIMTTWINNISAHIGDAEDVDVAFATTTTAMSFDTTTGAATITPARIFPATTTTRATTTVATTTTTIATYVFSFDITTIASNLSPLSHPSQPLSLLSSYLLFNRPSGSQ